MADILIRMEMPRNCFECPLFSNCDACEGHECGCGLLGGIGYEEDISKDRRRDDCPIVELPEHGDLIDRDEYIAMMESNCDKSTTLDSYIFHVCRGGVKTMPVIVPPNREETE